MKIWTNFYGSQKLLNKEGIKIKPLSKDKSFRQTLLDFWKSRNDELVIFNISSEKIYLFALLKYIWPLHKAKIVSVDILLRRPTSTKEKVIAIIKSLLLKKVALFILYFKDTSLYSKYFHLDPDKSVYIPFKVNIWDKLSRIENLMINGEYILLAGQGLRDLDTFIDAMKTLKYPAKILYLSLAKLKENGSRFTKTNIPNNITLVKHNGAQESWIDIIQQAKLVVIPRIPQDIGCTGISTYLDAMALNRCSILGKGVGTSDLLTKNEAYLVTPGNPKELANTIDLLWNNTKLRNKIRKNGFIYARNLEGEKRLIKDIIMESINYLRMR